MVAAYSSRKLRSFGRSFLPASRNHPRGLVDQILVVLEQHAGDLERVGNVTLPYEVGGTNDGCAPFPYALGARQFVEYIARLIEQVAADHVWGTDIDQVPVVDLVRTPQIEIEQLLSARFWRSLAAGLFIHDAQAAGPHFVDGTLEQLLDLFGRHPDELFGKPEDPAHAHPHKLMALAILAFASLDVSLTLLRFFW